SMISSYPPTTAPWGAVRSSCADGTIFGSLTRSVGAIDIGAWLPSVPGLSVQGGDAGLREEINAFGSLNAHHARFAFAHDRVFQGMQCVRQPVDVADVDPII